MVSAAGTLATPGSINLKFERTRRAATIPMESDATRILSLLKARIGDRPLIFDVGSSTGAWTWQAISVFPEACFELFEPMLAVSDVYRDRLQTLLSTTTQVHSHPVAVGAANGLVTMHVTPDAVSSTTIDWPAGTLLARQVQVEMVTLDTFVAQKRTGPPDLIKMDIQGGELDALRGAVQTLPEVKALMLETWLVRGYGDDTPLLPELCGFLAPFGFWLFDLGEQFRFEDGTMYALDACFVR